MEQANYISNKENWYALYTKSRAEKNVAKRLQNLGIQTYCPVQKTLKQWSDRKVHVEEVIFKSYVFVCLKERNMNQVFNVPGVVRYLFWLGKPAVIKDEEIKIIKSWLEDESKTNFEITGLEKGDEFNLENGVWRNHKAVVQEIYKDHVKLVLPQIGFMLKAKLSSLVNDPTQITKTDSVNK